MLYNIDEFTDSVVKINTEELNLSSISDFNIYSAESVIEIIKQIKNLKQSNIKNNIKYEPNTDFLDKIRACPMNRLDNDPDGYGDPISLLNSLNISKYDDIKDIDSFQSYISILLNLFSYSSFQFNNLYTHDFNQVSILNSYISNAKNDINTYSNQLDDNPILKLYTILPDDSFLENYTLNNTYSNLYTKINKDIPFQNIDFNNLSLNNLLNNYNFNKFETSSLNQKDSPDDFIFTNNITNKKILNPFYNNINLFDINTNNQIISIKNVNLNQDYKNDLLSIFNNQSFSKFINSKNIFDSDINPIDSTETENKKNLISQLEKYKFNIKKQTFFHKLPIYFMVRFTTISSEDRQNDNRKYDPKLFEQNFLYINLPTLDLTDHYTSKNPTITLENSTYQIDNPIMIKYKLHSVILKSINHYTYIKYSTENSWILYDDDNVSKLNNHEAYNIISKKRSLLLI